MCGGECKLTLYPSVPLVVSTQCVYCVDGAKGELRDRGKGVRLERERGRREEERHGRGRGRGLLEVMSALGAVGQGRACDGVRCVAWAAWFAGMEARHSWTKIMKLYISLP